MTALVAAFRAARVGPGDEVIVPSFTFIATANAVRLIGAGLVFANAEPETYGLDSEDVEAQATDRTAAVVPVYLYRAPCRIEALREIADHDLLVQVEFTGEYEHSPIMTADNTLMLLKKETGIG